MFTFSKSKISIGIPTFNRPAWLIKTVKQFIELSDSRITDIVILDQTKWDYIDEDYKIELLNLAKNEIVKYINEPFPSLPLARNKIIKQSEGDIIIWVDDDVIIPNKFIDYHLECYSKPGIVASAGQIYQRLESINEELFNISNFAKNSFKAHSSQHMGFFDGPLVGCNHSTLKAAVIKINGVDENYGGSGYYSDADLGDRLKLEFGDKSIIYSEKASVLHVRSKNGGCKIDGNKRSEKDNIFPFVFYYYRFRFGTKKTFTGLYEILRVGPLRKSKLKTLSFFNSLYVCLNLLVVLNRKKCDLSNIKSILKNN